MTNEEFLSTLTSIPDHELCELACGYAIAQELSEGELTPQLGHLLHEHDSLEAAELLFAMLKFHTYCARREKELFQQYGIKAESRFEGNCEAVLAKVTTVMNALRTERDVAESATAVKH